jgi:hypothetical protein
VFAAVQEVLESLGCSDEDRSQLVSHLLAIHQSAEAQLDAAPRQFLSCAELYASTVVSKREQLLQQQHFLKVGFANCGFPACQRLHGNTPCLALLTASKCRLCAVLCSQCMLAFWSCPAATFSGTHL